MGRFPLKVVYFHLMSIPTHKTPLPEIASCGWALHGRNKKESYLLPDLWSLHLFQYSFTLDLEKRGPFHISPGDCTLIPPGRRSTFYYRSSENQHLYCLFKGEGLLKNEGQALLIAREDLPQAFPSRFETLLRLQATEPLKAAVRLLDMLWELEIISKPDKDKQSVAHPLVLRCMAEIRMRLSEGPKVTEMAQRFQVSHNHLTRLFLRETGITVQKFITREKHKRACYLLKETQLPIKRIAQECGMRDIQHFNKFLRALEGLSPRSFRDQYRNAL